MQISANITYCRIIERVVNSVFKKKVFVIDVGQSVDTLHPMWEEFLKRDIHNILVFFNSYVNIPLLEEAEDSLYHAITEMTLSKEEFIQIFCNNS